MVPGWVAFTVTTHRNHPIGRMFESEAYSMNSNVLRIFIGYDPVESVAWHTMAHSILSRSSVPVAIVPVNIAMRG